MKWRTVRSKLIVFLLLATIIPMLATMLVTYTYTSKSLKERVATQDMNLLYQGANNISAMLENLNRSTTSLYSIQSLIQGGYNDTHSESRVYDILRGIANAVPNVFQVYLYENTNRKATLLTSQSPNRAYDTDVFNRPSATVQVQPTRMSDNYGFASLTPKLPPRYVFTFQRKIERIPSADVIGYLSVDVDIRAMANIVNQLYEKDREKIYIIDENQHVIYSDDPKQYGHTFTAPWYQDQIANSEFASNHFEQEGNVFIYQRIPDKNTNWTIVKQVPVSYLTKEATQAAGINLLLLGISLVIIIFATIIISIRITAPIRQLSRYMSLIQIGNLNVAIPPAKSHDEMGKIINRFRDMMSTINNLILREYKLELSNKTNQLKAMQAQINPHFLNNTLQIIGTLALELNAPQVYKLLSALAKMMHYSMHNDKKIVTLRDEIEHVKAYIELQKERFENRFTIRYDIDEALLDLLMPKMILQPVIENYFKHGINRHAYDEQISIRAFLGEPDIAIIHIINNGASIPEARLEEVNKSLRDLSTDLMKIYANEIGDNSSSSSIGLANVLARLKLLCGEQANLEICNQTDQGVSITLTIPVNHQVEREVE